MAPQKQLDWPPENGLEFVQSETFGRELLAICEEIRRRHPELDFSDSVAEIFEWLDKRLSREPRFLNQGAFPSFSAFRGYIRTGLLRVALLRKRQSRRKGEFLPYDSSLLDPGPSPEAIAIRDEMIDRLGSPCAEIVRKLFNSTREEIGLFAADLRLAPEKLEEQFERCLDRLRSDPEILRRISGKRRRRRG
jgi:hypothetical protein